MTAAINYRDREPDTHLLFVRSVADAARGQWHSVLGGLGIEVPGSHTRHGPCPACGGADRFRFDDKEGRGSHICNQCGAGDGLDLVSKVYGCQLLESARLVAPLVGCGGDELPTGPQRDEARQKALQHQQERERKAAESERRGISKARALWEAGQALPEDNQYLTLKRVGSHGLRGLADPLEVASHRFEPGAVMVPRYRAGELVGVQLIDPNVKRHIGPTKGSYHAIGKPQGALYICEGYATGAAIHEASGQAVAVAFDAGNLLPVGQALKAKYPDLRLIIAADNDHQAESNTGLEKGRKAAQALGVEWCYPAFPQGAHGSDFNDLASLAGVDKVQAALACCQMAEAEQAAPGIEWPEVKPIGRSLPSVESFYPELLPESLRAFVVDLSERKDNAPMDFGAVGVMVALGCLLGRKLGIHPKRHDDWLVVPNLWGVIVGRPSMKKTPTLDDAIKPLKRLEIAARERHQAEAFEHQAALKLDQLQQKDVEKRAARLVKEGRHDEAQALLLDGVENAPIKPARKRYLLNDATVEKLGEILAENPMGVLQYRDELTGWLKSLERDDRGQDRAFYLEAWGGSGSFTYDRIGRGTVDIPSTTVSVLGGIQPGKLQPYLMAQRDGSGDDGFIERLQLMVYPDQGAFLPVDRWPNQDAKAHAYEVFERFEAIPPSEGEIPALRFEPEAQALFNDWYVELMSRIRRQGDSPQIESHLSKYPSLMASLALIIHVAQDGAEGPVSLDATVLAAAWCEYLESHARRVYALANDPLVGARTLADRLHLLPDPFRVGDFNNKQWAGLTSAEEIQRAVTTLCQHGYLVREEIKTATKPRVVFHINPAAKEG